MDRKIILTNQEQRICKVALEFLKRDLKEFSGLGLIGKLLGLRDLKYWYFKTNRLIKKFQEVRK